MALFQQKPEEHRLDWAGLPSEPKDPDTADTLAEVPHVDSFVLGLGVTTSISVGLEVQPIPSSETAPIPVVGAVITSGTEVLCAQRGPDTAQPGLWEFPGGKVEPGEHAPTALVREIDEELGCQIIVDNAVASTRHSYAFGDIVLDTYYARILAGEPRATEHTQLRWVQARDLLSLDWAPADIPAVQQIMQDLTSG